jgi:hypothetical protein
MIKSRRMRWARQYHKWGRRDTHIGYWWESQRARDHQEDKNIDEWIILRWILE